MRTLYVAGVSQEHADENFRTYLTTDDETAIQILRDGLVNGARENVEEFIAYLVEIEYPNASEAKIYEYPIKV